MTDTDSNLSLVGRKEIGPLVRKARIAGVVLAAGTSSRFGSENKLLTDIEGRPLVVHAVRTLLDARLDSVTVVVGYEAAHVRRTLDEFAVELVTNDAYAEGQATSVRAGINAVSGADAALFALGDMPRIRTRTVNTLIDAYRAEVGDALAAAHDGRRGNPVLFDARYFDALASLHGDTGGRSVLLGAQNAALVETGNPNVHQDINTRDDLNQLENSSAASDSSGL